MEFATLDDLLQQGARPAAPASNMGPDFATLDDLANQGAMVGSAPLPGQQFDLLAGLDQATAPNVPLPDTGSVVPATPTMEYQIGDLQRQQAAYLARARTPALTNSNPFANPIDLVPEQYLGGTDLVARRMQNDQNAYDAAQAKYGNQTAYLDARSKFFADAANQGMGNAQQANRLAMQGGLDEMYPLQMSEQQYIDFVARQHQALKQRGPGFTPPMYGAGVGELPPELRVTKLPDGRIVGTAAAAELMVREYYDQKRMPQYTPGQTSAQQEETRKAQIAAMTDPNVQYPQSAIDLMNSYAPQKVARLEGQRAESLIPPPPVRPGGEQLGLGVAEATINSQRGALGAGAMLANTLEEFGSGRMVGIGEDRGAQRSGLDKYLTGKMEEYSKELANLPQSGNTWSDNFGTKLLRSGPGVVGSMLPALAATAASGGNPVVGFGVAFLQEGGASYAENVEAIRQAKNGQLTQEDMATARNTALAVGVLNGLLEKAGVDEVLGKGLLSSAAGRAIREPVTARRLFALAGRAAAKTGAAAGGEGVTEYLQELSSMAGQGYATASATGQDILPSIHTAMKPEQAFEAAFLGTLGGGGASIVTGGAFKADAAPQQPAKRDPVAEAKARAQLLLSMPMTAEQRQQAAAVAYADIKAAERMAQSQEPEAPKPKPPTQPPPTEAMKPDSVFPDIQPKAEEQPADVSESIQRTLDQIAAENPEMQPMADRLREMLAPQQAKQEPDVIPDPAMPGVDVRGEMPNVQAQQAMPEVRPQSAQAEVRPAAAPPSVQPEAPSLADIPEWQRKMMQGEGQQPAPAAEQPVAGPQQAAKQPWEMTREEFEATGQDLLHGTNREFDKFDSSNTKNRYGKPNSGKFYFTDSAEVAGAMSNSGGYQTVSLEVWADRNDLDGSLSELAAQLRESLDKSIGKGWKLRYEDDAGKLREAKSAAEVSDDILQNGDVRLYAPGRSPRVVTARVYGRTLDLTDPDNIPADLMERLKREGKYNPAERMPNFRHEYSDELVAYARENGYGKIKVRDTYESGYQSTIALEEYIGMGRDAHRESVAKAIAAGKPVPAAVLADYPDLKPQPAPAVEAAQPQTGASNEEVEAQGRPSPEVLNKPATPSAGGVVAPAQGVSTESTTPTPAPADTLSVKEKDNVPESQTVADNDQPGDRGSASAQSEAEPGRTPDARGAEGEGSGATVRGNDVRSPDRGRSGSDENAAGEPDGRPAVADAPGVGSDGAGTGTGDRVPRAPRKRDSGRNYSAPAGSLTRQGSWLDTAKRNLEIIKLVKQLEAENKTATPEQQALIAQYVGFGASELANKLFPTDRSGDIIEWKIDKAWRPVYDELKSILSPDEFATLRRSTQYAHYTSEPVIRSIWEAVRRMGFEGGRVLEPGMGTGLFMVAAPKDLASNIQYVGVEMDHLTAAIAKQLLPAENVIRNSYVDQKFPDNFFDAAIGNPPFSRTKIEADPRYRKNRFALHDYFFAKTIDKVKPGGIVVFITSRYTMDKVDEGARSYLADRANLVGAIRLPQTAFKANAGTEVVTDVLFFQKRADGEPASGPAWSSLKEIQTPEGPAKVNEYFADHPEMVLGQHSLQGSMYSSKEYTLLPNPGNIEEQFATATKNLPEGIVGDGNPAAGISASVQEVADNAIRADFNVSKYKEGGLYVGEGGQLMQVVNGVGKPFATDQKPEIKQWLKDYVGLRDSVKSALADQLSDSPNWESSHKELQKTYKAFVNKHGRLLEHTQFERKVETPDGEIETRTYKRFKRGKLLSSQVDADASVVFALEKINDTNTNIEEGDILAKRVLERRPPPIIKGPEDALAISMNELGKFSLDDVADRLKVSREEAIQTLGDLIYEAPGGSWQTADEYLSGDVVAKLDEAQAAASTDDRYQRNVEALQKVQPRPLRTDEIIIRLGSNWIPAEVVTDFANNVAGVKGDVEYSLASNTWTVAGSSLRSNREAGAEFGTAQRSPAEILDAVLNNRSITVQAKGPDDKPYVDKEATAAANEKADAMRQKFAEWFWSDATRTQEMLNLYNRKYNNLAARRYGGDHMTLPGLAIKFKLHPHQLRAIWRVVQTGNSYLAHAVGAGKTLEMIVSAMEQKRLGLIKKPMFVVPNHMLEQFSNEFLAAYPAANILVADEENFAGDQRRRFVAKAALNDWDAVIIKQSSFKKIGVKQETADAIATDLLAELQAALEEVSGDDRVTRKRIEQQIEAVQQKVAKVVVGGEKDANLSFEELGVDFLYVDEAHLYRKLDYATNRKVKGIDPNGSGYAFDLFAKLRYLHSKRPGRSVVLASGTPITNTIAELYTVQRYMDYDGLRNDGLHAFDAWANMFGEARQEWERNAIGEFDKVERFSRFVNVPELMSRVRQFMDVVTMDQLGKLVQRPDLIGGKPEMVATKPSDVLDRYMKGPLKQRLEASKAWKPSKEEPNNPDPVINIATDGRLAAIDMRLVNNAAPNDPTSKLNVMIDKIIETHNAIKGNVYTTDGKADPIKGGTQIVFSTLGFGENVEETRGFSPRKWLVQRLAKAGIPSNQIAFMGDYKTDAQKEAMFKEMREGKKRILIGSPKNMGTGVNVQKRLTELHYLAPPWYPADIEQPHGRILRQGNQNGKVKIRWYVTESTYDSAMWGMVRRKGAAIEQAFRGDDIRSVDDISEVSQYAMAEAVASGDSRMIELGELKSKIEKLNRLRHAHFDEQSRVKHAIDNAKASESHLLKQIARDEASVEALGDQSTWNAPITVSGQKYDKAGELGKAVLEALAPLPETKKPTQIGTIGTFPLLAEVGKVRWNDEFVPSYSIYTRIGGQEFPIKTGFGSDMNDVSLGQAIRGVLRDPHDQLDRHRRSLQEARDTIDRYTPRYGAPFGKEQELAEAIAAHARLESELTSSNNGQQTGPQTVEEAAGNVVDSVLRFPPETGKLDALIEWATKKIQERESEIAKTLGQQTAAARRRRGSAGSLDPEMLLLKVIRALAKLGKRLAPGQKLSMATLPLNQFGAAVQTIGDEQTSGFGTNKVYLSDVFNSAKSVDPTLTRGVFNRRLIEAHQKGDIALSRADLIAAMDPERVQASQVNHLNAEFHFLQVEPRDRQMYESLKDREEKARQARAAESPAPSMDDAEAARQEKVRTGDRADSTFIDRLKNLHRDEAGTLDPAEFALRVLIGAAKIGKGAQRFVTWSKAMIAQFPGTTKAEMMKLWRSARRVRRMSEDERAVWAKDAFKIPAKETTKQTVRRVTGQTERARLVSETDALRAKFQAAQAASAKGYKAGVDETTAMRKELVRLINETLPAAEAGKLLNRVASLKSMTGLRYGITKLREVLADYDVKQAVERFEKMAGKIRLQQEGPQKPLPMGAETETPEEAAAKEPKEPRQKPVKLEMDKLTPENREKIKPLLDRAKNIKAGLLAATTIDEKYAGIAQMKEVYADIAQIVVEDRAAREVKVLDRVIERDRLVEDLIGKVDAQSEPPSKTAERDDESGNRIVRSVRAVGRLLRNAAGRQSLSMATIATHLDPEQGDIYNLTIQNVRDAQERYYDGERAWTDHLAKALAAAGIPSGSAKLDSFLNKKETLTLPGAGDVTMTRNHMVGLLAAAGDVETNKLILEGVPFTFREQELAKGFSLTLDDINAIYDHLTPGERELVKAFTTFNEQQITKPLMQASLDLRGTAPDPHEGYFPRKRNRKQNPVEGAPTGWRDIFRKANEEISSLQERADDIKQPLFVPEFIQDAYAYVEDALRIMHIAEPVRSAAVVWEDPRVRSAIQQRFGNSMNDRVQQFLVDTSQVRLTPPKTWIEKVASLISRNFSRAVLQANPKPMAKNVIGGTLKLMGEFNMQDWAAGVAKMFSPDVYKRMMANSGVAWHRYHDGMYGSYSVISEKHVEAVANLDFVEAIKAGRLGAAIDAIKLMAWADSVPFRAAYAAAEAFVDRTMPNASADERKQAVLTKFHDATYNTQNGTSSTELSGLASDVRRNVMLQPLLAFTSDSNKSYNMLAKLKNADNATRAKTIAAIVLNALASAAVTAGFGAAARAVGHAIGGGEPPEDEKKKAAKRAWFDFIRNLASTAYFAGDIGDLMFSWFGEGKPDFSTPAGRVQVDTINAIQGMGKAVVDYGRADRGSAKESEAKDDMLQSLNNMTKQAEAILGVPLLPWHQMAEQGAKAAKSEVDPRVAEKQKQAKSLEAKRDDLPAGISDLLKRKNKLDAIGKAKLTPAERAEWIRLRSLESAYERWRKAVKAKDAAAEKSAMGDMQKVYSNLPK